MDTWRWRRGYSLSYVARTGGWPLGSVFALFAVITVGTGFRPAAFVTFGIVIGVVALAILLNNLLPTKAVTSAEVTADGVTLVFRYRRRTYPRKQLRAIWFQYESYNDWGWVYFELIDEDRRVCIKSWSGRVNREIAEEASRATGAETRWAPEKSRPSVTPQGVEWTSTAITGFNETFE